MSRNTQFYTQLPHEGLYGTQPIMDQQYSTHQQLLDHNQQQQQQLHHWGSAAANQNQVVWYHTSQEGARTQQSVISDDEEELSGGGGRGGANEVEEEAEEEQREHMFEKPLTPSDVGKLNRLVIPKQHAEKYLPLGGHDSLLSFEDESGKDWRFRYSYWNSSQSYVLTKGWSRFVKEKHLDAGDIVMFQRRRFDNERLYIRWRRRNSPTTTASVTPVEFCSSARQSQVVPNSNCNSNSSSSTTTNSTWNHANFYQQQYHHHQQQQHHQYPYPSPLQHHNHHVPLLYQTPYLHAVGHNKDEAAVEEKMKLARAGGGGGNSKKFRLFGVNLDLPN
ncbi:hypothetical protein MKW94_024988 [Papaver nudicaule]|uniref:TF-B3 domain-containing protein n=1 Tax=Papaver nudicaule TaxID=74823 RepID=A0AA41V6C2_PAPNU|nr:hypothetical protein [Papaver nudicaule]